MRQFSWSYSSLTDFEGCPARYAAKRYYQTTKEEPTEHTIWGERVHKAFEERLRDGKPFHSDLARYDPWARVLEKLPGEKFYERKFAVDARWEPCGWPEGVGRGVVDLLILTEDVATIIDYKTGKKKDDETQAKLFCWFVSNEYPEVRKFKYRYIWLKTGTTTGGEIKREDLMKVEVNTRYRVSDMRRAWDAENFPCFPSGLCGWCPVEECIHFRPRRER
jgi:hypothetical protein